MFKNSFTKFLFQNGIKTLNHNLKNMKNMKTQSHSFLYKFQNFSFSMDHNISNSMGMTNYEAITVNNIRDNKGARPAKTKLGRGPGSGRGKTSGRGHKGYKARVGNINRHYEGGQTPITRRLPKFGFRNTGKEDLAYLNLEKLIYIIQKGRIDAMKPITIRDLFWSGAISNVRKGVKILSRGSELLKELPPLHLEVSSASEKAIEEIKNAGGSVKVIHRTATTLSNHVEPWKFIRTPIDPVPKFKKVVRLLHLEEKGVR
jgi:large subunit ribosomal protein L15